MEGVGDCGGEYVILVGCVDMGDEITSLPDCESKGRLEIEESRSDRKD